MEGLNPRRPMFGTTDSLCVPRSASPGRKRGRGTGEPSRRLALSDRQSHARRPPGIPRSRTSSFSCPSRVGQAAFPRADRSHSFCGDVAFRVIIGILCPTRRAAAGLRRRPGGRRSSWISCRGGLAETAEIEFFDLFAITPHQEAIATASDADMRFCVQLAIYTFVGGDAHINIRSYPTITDRLFPRPFRRRQRSFALVG